MARVTMKSVEFYVDLLNAALKDLGIDDVHYEVREFNDYKRLSLMRGTAVAMDLTPTGCTTREVYEQVHAVFNTLEYIRFHK